MNRQAVSTLPCAVLAIGLLSAPASGAEMPTVPPTGSTHYGSPLLSGQLMNASGSGIRSTGQLTMYAWPSNKVLDKLATGETAKLLPIARADTDAVGRFAFEAADAAAVARYSVDGEPVNVTVAGTSAAGDYWYGTSINPAIMAEGGTALARSGAVTDTAHEVVIKPSASGNAQADRSQKYENGPAFQDKFCGTTAVATYGQVPAQIAGTFVYSTGATADYQFSAGANSSLGVAVSGGGQYGSFNAGGTSSLKSSFTLDFPRTTSGSRFHHVYVIPRKFRTDAASGRASGQKGLFCARPSPGTHRNACHGDSGSPVYTRHGDVAGFVMGGIGCGDGDDGLYAKP